METYMKMELQVCSVELAEKLQRLGVSQDANFYWTLEKSGDDYVTNLRRKGWKVKWYENDRVATFSVAELGEMLPSLIQNDGDFWLMIHKLEDAWVVFYQTLSNWNVQTLHRDIADTEADCRAKMLIYLLENKLITL